MSANNALADSSFVYSLFNQATQQHQSVLKAIQQLRGQLIMPVVCLTEVAFLFHRTGGITATTRFLTALASAQPPLESINFQDLIRARDIMNAYPSANLDFVDCCIAAIAERLNITQIATLDRRDFSIMRPSHVSAFTLIP